MTITCPFCGAVNEATVQNLEQAIPLCGGPTLHLVLPVWECLLCREMWTDEVAEGIREHAIREALGEESTQC